MTAPVYLIASPDLRTGRKHRDHWKRWTTELAQLLPGAHLAAWDDLPAAFAQVPASERPARLAKAMSAAVVLPDKRTRAGTTYRFIGLGAATEARAFAAAGKPVMVYAAGVLTPWADCEVRPGGPTHTPLQLLTPETSARNRRAAR